MHGAEQAPQIAAAKSPAVLIIVRTIVREAHHMTAGNGSDPDQKPQESTPCEKAKTGAAPQIKTSLS
jgi:hypothetical protein